MRQVEKVRGDRQANRAPGSGDPFDFSTMSGRDKRNLALILLAFVALMAVAAVMPV